MRRLVLEAANNIVDYFKPQDIGHVSLRLAITGPGNDQVGLDPGMAQELLDQDQRSDAALCPSRAKACIGCERLDVRTEPSTDTTTDTRAVEHSHANVAVLL
jgi:hypothetical protein